MRLHPMASVGMGRGLPAAGGRGTPLGFPLPSPVNTVRGRPNPGSPKLTMSQEIVTRFPYRCAVGVLAETGALCGILLLQVQTS
jgi:hypothetical protein